MGTTKNGRGGKGEKKGRRDKEVERWRQQNRGTSFQLTDEIRMTKMSLYHQGARVCTHTHTFMSNSVAVFFSRVVSFSFAVATSSSLTFFSSAKDGF